MNPQRIFKLISIQREISLAVSYRLLCMSYANVVNKAVGIRFRLPCLLLLCLLLLLHTQFLGLSRKLLILIDVLLFFPSPAATSNDLGRPVVVVEMLLLLSILLVVVVVGIFVRRGKATVCGCVCPAGQ